MENTTYGDSNIHKYWLDGPTGTPTKITYSIDQALARLPEGIRVQVQHMAQEILRGLKKTKHT